MRTRLRPGEDLVAVVRRHVVVLGGPFAVGLFLSGCLIGAFFVRRPYVRPAAAVLLLLAAAWGLWRWLEWRADLWAVTSQRVIDESGVLTVRAVDSPLDKINEVTSTQSIWGRMLGYGDLNIQTAAEVGSTTIETVARPMELKETILEQQERARYNVAARQAAPFVAAAGGQGRATVLSAAGAVPDAARDDMRECPYCAETIKARAKVCRFCGRSL
ncbi:MAG TPA: PH domain-containing protein [Candidatus Dormibacteraeota bacterium]|nr:PH domain-containing protein [Candidatus Dormibacteraeota bacterium]